MCSSKDWWNQKADAPWKLERPGASPFKSRDCPFFDLPHGDDPTKIFTDVAHTFHIHGVGVDFAASSVVLCCRKGLFGTGKLDACIYRAYCAYIEYCAKFKKTTACKPWNGHDDLGMANNNDFPSSIKGKGFDTALVCSWVSVFLESQDVAHDPDLQMLKFTASQINNFFRLMHRSHFWIDHQTRQEVVRYGELWVEGYANLAARMASQGLLLYRVRPKLHMFGELVLSLYQGTTGTMNVLTTSCWADEDFIGVVSQTSRSCSRGMTGLALSFSTLQKCLGRYKIQFAKLN